MEYLALFETTTASVKFRRRLQKHNIRVEAIPVPRKLSAGCGIAILFFTLQDPLSLIDVGLDKIYRIENDDYVLIYKSIAAQGSVNDG